MEKELLNTFDGDLLLKDLCGRLPYGVFCEGITTDIDIDTDRYYNRKVKGVLSVIHHYNSDYATIGLMSECNLETIKPYLFPLRSLTSSEADAIEHIMGCNIPWNIQYGFLEWTVGGSVESETFELKICQVEKMMEFLNSHHFDYRGLIEKGLAIDATGLNIYNEERK